MRLNFTQSSSNQHRASCSAVVWAANELYSCGDDQQVWKWNMSGEPVSRVAELEASPIDIKWFPQLKRGEQGKDLFVAACADGQFRLVSAVTGRVEKQVEAHQGALVCLAWNHEGSALVTGGEDGLVKVWSQAGMLRATLAQQSQCIHCLCWSPESDQVCFASGKDLFIKPLQPSSKQFKWQAHNGAVLAADWSPVNQLIVSGGEDLKYKVWDSYGRKLYESGIANEYAITAVSWSPDGQCFAVGSFGSLRICDKTGWTHCRDECNSGSVFKIAWTSDSTQLAAAGGNGAVVFAQMLDRKLSYGKFEFSLREANRIRIHNVTEESAEELEHPDKIIKMSVGHNHLVVATTTQCVVYNVDAFNSPRQFDVKDTVNLILQAEKLFAIVDSFNGIQLYNYDGRSLSTVKAPVLRTASLNVQSLSLSNDTFAIKDASESKSVKVYDCSNGKPRSDINIVHHMEIAEVALSQYGDTKERKLSIVDRNRDLYIATVQPKVQMHKLATMVSSVHWNSVSEVLVAIADGRLVVWYYPSVVFVDRDLLPKTKSASEEGQVSLEFGKNDQITDFCGTRISIRRGKDGAMLTFSCSPFPNLLFNNIRQSNWESATRLCRVVKESFMWSILAGLSVRHGQLESAETAYAALEESDKLAYVRYIMDIPVPEGRAAELALFQRRLDEAEQILLQAGLHYRAIRMHLKLFNWDRALDLASQYKTHVDTVLAFRQNYLSQFGKVETQQKFKAMAEGIEINWDRINSKIEEEKQKEKQRRDAKPYQRS
eukprot:TRINITY_DN70329_c0_g1_i1.p1 TRINITY_DN70329_c0_g1~~TRINITY_DN70329_c0_g1_i1.p1  ORF type:complete len:771 (+),score=329.83 TRINITY_DN70329_c0_g1_i1:99-2411(+)